MQLIWISCNDFSNLGEKNGLLGKYGPLYKEALKIVNLINPKFFVAENVTESRALIGAIHLKL